MDKANFLNVPLEIFVSICNSLSFFDIASLEQTCKCVKERIGQTSLWKKKADQLDKKFKFQLTKKLIMDLKQKKPEQLDYK